MSYKIDPTKTNKSYKNNKNTTNKTIIKTKEPKGVGTTPEWNFEPITINSDEIFQKINSSNEQELLDTIKISTFQFWKDKVKNSVSTSDVSTKEQIKSRENYVNSLSKT
ncbi:MAG: hypothetical protein ACRC4M_05965, partial [Mycoplasma sp.]